MEQCNQNIKLPSVWCKYALLPDVGLFFVCCSPHKFPCISTWSSLVSNPFTTIEITQVFA